MSSYHKSPDGVYRPCSTTPDACKYKSSHIPQETYDKLDADGFYVRDVNTTQSIPLGTAIETTMVATKKVAPVGLSPLYCLYCGAYFTREEADSLGDKPGGCGKCGKKAELESSGVDIDSNEMSLLTDEAVRARSWFHVTVKENWLDTVSETGDDDPRKQALVHIGSRQASTDRLRDMAKYLGSGTTIYVHELKLDPTSKIAKGLFEDDEDLCPANVGDVKTTGYEANGVTRYVNSYEAPGTISLLANPNYLVETHIEQFTL